MYRRARVAITLSYGLDPSGRPKASSVPTIHIGHARTLLIGSLAAKHYGCPFHIRLDGLYHYTAQDGSVRLSDRGDQVLSVVSCLAALRIQYDAMYWVPQDIGSLYSVPDAAKWRESWRIPDMHLAQVLDDAVDFSTSLMVRGTEFRPEIDPSSAGVVHLSEFVKNEDAVFHALGEYKNELTVPMVSFKRGKMSKSDIDMVQWDVLNMVGPESAKEFLIATVVNPRHPLDALGKPLDIEDLDLSSYRWEWSEWAAFVRQVC